MSINNNNFKDKMTNHLKEDLINQIRENIQSIDIEDLANKEIRKPKIYIEEELQERETCHNPSGFWARWLKCSLILDKLNKK